MCRERDASRSASPQQDHNDDNNDTYVKAESAEDTVDVKREDTEDAPQELRARSDSRERD